MSLESIIKKIQKERPKNYESFFHGIDHWERVHANGLKLCKYFEADSAVIRYFAHLHDCCRCNEDVDPEHGPRAAIYIDKLREDIDLNDDQIKLLKKACSGHTHAKPGAQAGLNLTLACCWNADRLDIERVGLTLDPKYLFTRDKTELAIIISCKSV